MHLCTHDAISSWIQVMPLCINQKGHDSQETVKQTTDVKGGKKRNTHSWLSSDLTVFCLREDCVSWWEQSSFLIPLFCLGSLSPQVWCWGTGSQHSWREDCGGWEILLTWPLRAGGVLGESVNAEAQEKADGEWEEEGGYRKISVIPAQEAQRTASHYSQLSKAVWSVQMRQVSLKLQGILPLALIN